MTHIFSRLLLSAGLIILHLSATSQNVGIGTTTPTRAKFEVFGAVGSTSAILGGDGAGVSFQRNNPGIGYNQYFDGANSRYIGAGPAFVQWLNTLTGSLNFDIFRTSGTANAIGTPERVLTIANTGNVSIEAAEANASLYVGGQGWNGYFGRTTRFQGTKYHSEFGKFDGIFKTFISGGKDGSKVFINDVSSGPVFITTNNGNRVGVNQSGVFTSQLDIKQVNGRGFVLVEPSTFHNWEFLTEKNLTEPGADYYVYYNGANKGNFFHIDGNYYPISDKRLKKDITQLTNVLDRVMQLRPASYFMKHDELGAQQIGFIAQEVERIFPELVERTNADGTGYEGLGEVLTINYDGLSPIVIKAIKEQQAIIQQLSTRNEVLKKRIAVAMKIMSENTKL